MKCYLIAKKLGHSFSKLIHNELADYEYEHKELEENELDAFFAEKDFDGLNVTIPYKQTVMKYLDEISPEAERIGAVNTIVNRGGKLIGHNTDYYGFVYEIKEAGAEIEGKDVVVLGRGGASKTVVCVCEDMGAKSVRLLTRDSDPEDFYDGQIVINATPVGMFPDTGKSVVDITKFTKCEAVLDLVYNPSSTKIILDAKRMGIKTANGLGMLVSQAKKACEIFTGSEIPDEKIDSIKKQIEFKTKNIVLVGMPGCGKTTVGKILANLTGKEFTDSDDEITKRGISPAEIIRSEGEAAFRKVESEVLSELCKKSGLIIATGGGCVTVENNHDILRQNGYVVFIERELKNLATDGRPLSTNVEKLWQVREPLYRSASDITVKSAEIPEKTAEEILKRIKG